MVHCSAEAKNLGRDFLTFWTWKVCTTDSVSHPPVVAHPGVPSQLQQGQEVKVFQDAILNKVHVVLRQIQLMKM